MSGTFHADLELKLSHGAQGGKISQMAKNGKVVLKVLREETRESIRRDALADQEAT